MFPISLINVKSAISPKLVSYFVRMRCNHTACLFQKEMFYNHKNTLFINKSFHYNIINVRYMAGHAKWQNIKHIKAAKDKEKSAVAGKYARLIRFAVRENGPDPKSNNKLLNLMEEAKRHNVSKEVMENALKRGDNKKTKFGTIEILAPGGCMVVLEYETASESTFRHEIKAICKKYNANILSGEGRWRAVFEKKGIITVCKELAGEQMDESKALDSAIEAGAEEVQMKVNEEGKNFLEFVCASEDLHTVKKELEKKYEVEEHYIACIPITTIELNNEDMTSVDNFLEEVGNVSDVVRIYENVQ